MEPLVIVSVLLLIFVVLPVASFALFMRAMAKANRVSPTIPTLAPLTWLFLPERPPRIHRRLRRAVQMARVAAAVHASSNGRGIGAVPELVDDLERRACVVDSQLVVAARAKGPARWSMLNELEQQAYEIDHLASRIAGMTSAWAATSTSVGRNGPAGLEAISERLDALEAAMHEVGAIGRGHPSFQPAATLPPQPIPYLRSMPGDQAK